uniref:Uncharacterized protein n=1 Tax=Anguilla anguilla TaxID=7936 RepID=A0A0E9U2S5_ANGAN
MMFLKSAAVKQSRWKHEAKRSASMCLALGEHCPEFPVAAVGTID